jgi:YD repeat-containing protein
MREFFRGAFLPSPRLLLNCCLALALSPSIGGAQDAPYHHAEHESPHKAMAAAGALHQVNELSNRRRLTTFFVNEQSPFYGVQLNYVNVGRGNLTFLKRDLVRLGRLPIVIGRVYDSRSSGQSDFGGGWKLTVAETIHVEGRNLRYVDASGSEHRLEVDGMRIRSPYPHLTGIERGRRVGPLVELDVGDLVKRFRPIGNTLYLDELRSREGDHLRLEYSGTQVVRVSSNNGRFVALERDSSGRVVGLEDDAGRTVGYEYDGAGRLVGVTDAGGRPWELTYDSRGLLVRVVDPRDSESLAATHGEDGRVQSVRVLFDSMSFEYQGTSTTVRNALQQAATFWQAPSGLTTIAQDFAGSVTEISLSEQLRPLTLTFDGSLMAQLAYGANERLEHLTSYVSSSPKTTELVYDAGGRVSSLLAGDEIVAEYGYDARGRVVSAEDALGHREYEYAGRALRRFTIDYKGLDLQINELGLLTGFRSDKQTVRLSYDERDQLRALNFDQEGQRSQTQFEYGPSGLRTAAAYTLGNDSENQETLAFDYDAVGNLTELLSEKGNGERGGQIYILGDNNELQVLRNSENRRPDLVYEYDFTGRPTAAVLDDRRTSFDYDELGRLTNAYQNDTELFEAYYGPMDVDAATEADTHTAYTAIAAPIASAIFGSLEEIAYARTRGRPYGPIRFNEAMGRFVLAGSLVPAPDRTLLASFQRRALPISMESHGYGGLSAELASAQPMGFDKPSNGLFVPAEFSSLNCYQCAPWVVYSGSGVVLKVNGTSSGTATAYVGQWTTVVVDRTTPYQCVMDTGYGVFYHYFGDDVSEFYAESSSFGTDIESSVGFYPSTSGTRTIGDYILCGCYPPYVTYFTQLGQSVQVLPTCIHHGTPSNGSLSGDSNLSDNGVGYYHFLGSDAQNTDDWACSNWTIYKIQTVGLWWNQSPEIGIGDISRQGGGSFQPDHSSHQNGLDVDVRYVRNDGQEGPLDFDLNPAQYDQTKTQQVVDRFCVAAGASVIYVDQRANLTGACVDPEPNHDDHLHVRFPDPDGLNN